LIKPLKVAWSAWYALWFLVTTTITSVLSVLVPAMGVSQKKAQWVPQTWSKLLVWGSGCSFKVEGKENLVPGTPYVFASNHTSALDIPFLQAVLPSNFRWLAKKELFGIFLFGKAMASMGYISVDRSNRRKAMQSVENAAARIKSGASVLIFPEGTRSKDGSLGEFKSAGLSLAIKAQAQVVPVAISGLNAVCPPESLTIDPGPVILRFGCPISTSGLVMKDRGDLTGQVRQSIVNLLEDSK
jgi:1-acyl-sn-glycerol-3-phosphate acyltransferase